MCNEDRASLPVLPLRELQCSANGNSAAHYWPSPHPRNAANGSRMDRAQIRRATDNSLRLSFARVLCTPAPHTNRTTRSLAEPRSLVAYVCSYRFGLISNRYGAQRTRCGCRAIPAKQWPLGRQKSSYRISAFCGPARACRPAQPISCPPIFSHVPIFSKTRISPWIWTSLLLSPSVLLWLSPF